MRWRIEQLIHKYDAATVFVGVATIIVIIELSLMRVFVPKASFADDQDFSALMTQVCSDESVLKVTRQIHSWEDGTEQLVSRLSGRPETWQKELETSYAFSDNIVEEEVIVTSPDLRSEQMLEVDFAIQKIHLQSVMIGRTPLANINGKIYTIGAKIPVMGGEILLLVTDIGLDHVEVQLADAIEPEETTRKIYLRRSSNEVNSKRRE